MSGPDLFARAMLVFVWSAVAVGIYLTIGILQGAY